MPLKSRLFKGDPKVAARLEACLVSDPAHVVPGARGEHVGKIQKALVTLGAGVISANEIESMTYGPTTARTVLAFKGPPRNIINRAYQRTPDNIVGKMTIEALDREFFDFENRPPPFPASIFVSLTPDGFSHDHSTCPFQFGRHATEKVHHLGTPMNPRGGFGLRKINLGGEGETKYLGFEDFLPSVFKGPGPIRPLTSSLPDHCASDICLRFTPILKDAADPTVTLAEAQERGKQEILRIANPGCRLTFCGFADDLATFGTTLLSMGTRIERVVMPFPFSDNKGATAEAWVIVM